MEGDKYSLAASLQVVIYPAKNRQVLGENYSSRSPRILGSDGYIGSSGEHTVQFFLNVWVLTLSNFSR